jgi:hypothetical protein
MFFDEHLVLVDGAPSDDDVLVASMSVVYLNQSSFDFCQRERTPRVTTHIYERQSTILRFFGMIFHGPIVHILQYLIWLANDGFVRSDFVEMLVGKNNRYFQDAILVEI